MGIQPVPVEERGKRRQEMEKIKEPTEDILQGDQSSLQGFLQMEA